MSAARNGEPQAVRELYQAYRGPIWTLIVYMVGDPLQTQDVLQNVFMKAFRGLKSFRFQSRFFTWIYRIALNECRNHRRKRDIPHVPLEAILGSRDEIDKTTVSEESEAYKTILREAVKRLPEKMREVILLKYREDLSYEEISGIIGCAPGTVASRLNRALAALEERLKLHGFTSAKSDLGRPVSVLLETGSTGKAALSETRSTGKAALSETRSTGKAALSETRSTGKAAGPRSGEFALHPRTNIRENPRRGLKPSKEQGK